MRTFDFEQMDLVGNKVSDFVFSTTRHPDLFSLWHTGTGLCLFSTRAAQNEITRPVVRIANDRILTLHDEDKVNIRCIKPKGETARIQTFSLGFSQNWNDCTTEKINEKLCASLDCWSSKVVKIWSVEDGSVVHEHALVDDDVHQDGAEHADDGSEDQDWEASSGLTRLSCCSFAIECRHRLRIVKLPMALVHQS